MFILYFKQNQTEKSVELIESFIRIYYSDTSNIAASVEPHVLFEYRKFYFLKPLLIIVIRLICFLLDIS